VEDGGYAPEQNAGALVIEGVAYVGHSGKRFEAVRLRNQERLWSVPTAGGIHTTAAYADGVLIFGDDHGVVTAVNLHGEVQWTFRAEYPVVASPLIAEEKVYIGVSDQNVFCLEVGSGTPVWQYGRQLPRRHGLWRALGLCYGEGKLFVGFADGTLVALDAALGRVLWRREIGSSKLFGDMTAGPSFAAGRVFAAAFGGPVVCLDATNGDPFWRAEVGGVSGFAVGDERVYLGTPEGELVALTREGGREVWRVALDGGVPASPVLAGEAVVTSASRGGMYVLGAVDGAVLYHFVPGPGVRAQAAVSKEGIVFHSNGGVLHWVHRGGSWD
jgi:outer membrane protein assembly factor BamB